MLTKIVSKADARPSSALVEAVPQDDLQRLVETSPHLLEDIGFTKDIAQSNAAQTVWVSNGFRIVVPHEA